MGWPDRSCWWWMEERESLIGGRAFATVTLELDARTEPPGRTEPPREGVWLQSFLVGSRSKLLTYTLIRILALRRGFKLAEHTPYRFTPPLAPTHHRPKASSRTHTRTMSTTQSPAEPLPQSSAPAHPSSETVYLREKVAGFLRAQYQPFRTWPNREEGPGLLANRIVLEEVIHTSTAFHKGRHGGVDVIGLAHGPH